MQIFQRIGQSMYQSQQAQAQSSDEGAPTEAGEAQQEAESDDDVVEGEIVDEGGAS